MEARTAAFMAIWTADCIELTDEFEPEPLKNQKVNIRINTHYIHHIENPLYNPLFVDLNLSITLFYTAHINWA